MDLASAEQILFNLVDNACKHAPTRPSRRCSSRRLRGTRYVVLRLHDHGPGIEPRERRRIFRPAGSEEGASFELWLRGK